MAETLRRTSFGSLPNSHDFNLEQPLTLNQLIGGHLVQGHVDTTAKVTKIVKEGESQTVWFEIEPKFTKYMIYKGSITINGVSLTVVEIDKTTFSVSLIPYTLTHTNLGHLSIGDMVNIEVDMVAKYIEKLAKRG
jgi:riboflavin synthase